jgi:hypothetical protein
MTSAEKVKKESEYYETLRREWSILNEKYEKRKNDLNRRLREVFTVKEEAVLVLKKNSGIIKHMTNKQKAITGFSSLLKPPAPAAGLSRKTGSRTVDPGAGPCSLKPLPEAVNLSAGLSSGLKVKALKEAEIKLLVSIDGLKKDLLRIDVIEMRSLELTESIQKALKVFKREFKIIRRRLFPLMGITKIYRFIRKTFGGSYFSLGDIKNISVLGDITGSVLKMVN